MKILNIKFCLLFSIFSLLRLHLVESVCEIKYPSNVETSPIYAKVLGQYTVYLPYNGKDLFLNEGETIQGFCRTNFITISLYTEHRNYEYFDEQENKEISEQSSISLKCIDSKLHYSTFYLEQTVLACNKLSWSVYNTNEVYDWCENNKNSKTFLLAAKSSKDHHILAGICFNLNEWSLQTITYNVTNCDKRNDLEMRRDITKTHLKGYKSLGDELSNLKSNYFDFRDSDLKQQLAKLTEKNSWLILANYELSSIVQGETFKEYFNEFADTLNIIWWRNLRLGNWKNFMNTLENYAYNKSFQIYAGTSGAVQLPSKKSAENHILEMQIGYLNKTVPSYVWSYITATDGQNKDFVIVGYNSPFAEWFGVNEVVFCPDICSEIPWLREIASSFRYTTAGIMFCCSTDFVRQTNFLYGFPMHVHSTRSNQQQAEDASKNFTNSTYLEPVEQTNTEKDA